MLKLISLHVPKCAGNSFTEAFQSLYGKQAVHIESDKLIYPTSQFNLDPDGFMERVNADPMDYLSGKKIVHGHFYIRKYDRFKDVPRATILRHPVDRLISHYFYWKKDPGIVHELREYVMRKNLDIVQYARLPLMRYFYTRQFFRDVDMRMFDAIGDYGYMKGAAEKIGQLLGEELVLARANSNPSADYDTRRAEIESDAKIMGSLHDMLRDDIAFYERHALR